MRFSSDKIVKNEDGTELELIEPATGKAYLDRTRKFDYKIEKGFVWGGDWPDRKDYQHFEVSAEIAEKYSEMYSRSRKK